MRKAIFTVFIFLWGLQSALASDWHIMTDWHKAQGEARSAYFAAGNRFNTLPPRTFTAIRLAMFTAANAVEKEYTQYLEGIEAGEDADAVIAASAAAGHVMRTAFGQSAEAVIAKQEQKYFSGADPKVLKASIALGKAAAEAALARAAEVVDDKYPHYKPQTSAGVYITPHMPAFPPEFLDQKPWFIDSRDAVRAAPPPSLDSDVWARDFNEVKRLGGIDSKDRTKEQQTEALFWVGQSNEMLIDQAAERRNWTFLQTARLYAMLEMSIDDSTLAVAESKYHHNFWRPITSIRRAELDGRDDTTVDAGWSPFRRTPNHPEYPCAHCTRGGGTAEILENEVEVMDGETFRVFDPRTPDNYITISSFAEFEQRMSDSRIYIGAHYRSSNEAGEKMGRDVAKIARQKFAVPLN